jgi:hypothetical protein
MEVTRRTLARIAAALAAVPLHTVAQRTPADPLNDARQELKENAQQLAKVPVPMETEPAFRFKA